MGLPSFLKHLRGAGERRPDRLAEGRPRAHLRVNTRGWPAASPAGLSSAALWQASADRLADYVETHMSQEPDDAAASELTIARVIKAQPAVVWKPEHAATSGEGVDPRAHRMPGVQAGPASGRRLRDADARVARIASHMSMAASWRSSRRAPWSSRRSCRRAGSRPSPGLALTAISPRGEGGGTRYASACCTRPRRRVPQAR